MALFDTIQQLLMGGANAGLAERGINNVQAFGQAQQQGLQNLTNTIRSDLTFKPYTVTSATGSFTGGPEGGSSTLSPELQQMMQRLQEGAGMFYNRGLQDTGARASEITAQMEAALAPQRERERLALEQRLLGQGRLGVSTAAYGGTPEQLALAKAIEEQRAANAVNARSQAMNEQLQNMNIGGNLFNLSFVPQNQNLATMSAFSPFAELATRGQQQKAITTAELGQAGLNASTASEALANQLRTQQLQSLSDLLLGSQNTGAGLLSSIFNSGNTAPALGDLADWQRAILNR